MATSDGPPPIDLLLFRYLHLIDKYVHLTSRLSESQASLHVSLAEANFASAHGQRFGPEQFPATMEPRWRLDVTAAGEGDAAKDAAGPDKETAPSAAATTEDAQANGPEEQCDAARPNPGGLDIAALAAGVELGEVVPVFQVVESDAASDPAAPPTEKTDPGAGDDVDDEKSGHGPDPPKGGKASDPDDEPKPAEQPSKHRQKDPLFWVSALPGRALRQAQSQAVISATELVPQLATVAAEMRAVEIQIRRLRKHRAKATRQKQRQGKGEEEEKDVTAEC